MSEKTKNISDSKLIKKIFDITPIDWARYPDGKLSFISPTGQKFAYSPAALQAVEDANNAKAVNQKAPPKPSAAAAKKSASGRAKR